MKLTGYRIVGITPDMYEAWKDNLREDLIIYEKYGKTQIRIMLTWFEALIMRIRMIRYNLNNSCVLKLERDM